jgi:hypothetical protein
MSPAVTDIYSDLDLELEDVILPAVVIQFHCPHVQIYAFILKLFDDFP